MTDDRVLERRMEKLQETVSELSSKLAVIEERVNSAIVSVNTCLSKYEDLDEYLHRREEYQLKERKSDRRWLVGTVLSSAALVIAALGVLRGVV
jgi:chromosome segregation ATPase